MSKIALILAMVLLSGCTARDWGIGPLYIFPNAGH